MSGEAKKSLADAARQSAFHRLDRDGAHSTAALQRRVRALAQERDIPQADFAKLMYKRINTRDVMLFCEKHNVNYDWLLCGDLQGLHRMTKEAKATPEMVEAQRREVAQLFLTLSPRQQAVVVGYIRQLSA